MKKTIGGDRLGSGGKMEVRLKNYERSSHNMSKTVRTTMTSGTLIPVYTEPILKGDTWEMDISTLIRTHPTVGPLFGSWKLQVDVFTIDVRLYNKQLHNNLTGIGMNMKNILFPLMRLNGQNVDMSASTEANEQQISTSSLLAYLGVRGLGTLTTANGEGRVEILRNAMPLMGYWDIVKEYYSNKQEEIGFLITGQGIATQKEINQIRRIRNGESSSDLGNIVTGREAVEFETNDLVRFYGNSLLHDDILVTPVSTGMEVPLSSLGWAESTNDEYIEFLVVNGPISLGAVYQGNTQGTSIARAEGTTIGTGTEGIISVEKFPLSNIDDLREAVFAQPKTSPLIIGYNEEENRGLPYSATVGQTTVNLGEETKTVMNSFFTMAGLGLKTYQSDRFNNWLSTTYIDQVNSISSVDVSSGSFTMDALNLAKKVYELMNSVAVSGATYQDWLEAVYGEKAYGAPEMPVYRGGLSSEIMFDEVVSSSDAIDYTGMNQPLGTLGGRGIQKRVEGGKIRFRVEEHGYVMVIASLTPRIDYSQGNKWWGKLYTMDDYHKPALDQIGFQELLTDEMAAWDTKIGTDGTETFFSAGKQPSWTQYMTNQNETYGEFARINSEMFMTLNRRYQATGNEARIEDLTTYIDPGKFNYAFAYTGRDSQPFWAQFGFDVIARRKMSANKMPNV
ncbi:major capsid protein [Tortoise microvirus 18]|nr:major capsid protein [Tortoise microvirus 18]